MIATTGVSRSNLCQGAVYMLGGLLWGLAVPATSYPRLALGAHLQLTAHGVMFLVAGLVISRTGIGTGTLAGRILIAAPWLTWPVMLTEMANASWGTRQMLPIAGGQAGAPGAAAWQEGVVTGAHVLGAVVLILYWITILRLLLVTPTEEAAA
jgi:(hydroxyamino)benzene mutase